MFGALTTVHLHLPVPVYIVASLTLSSRPTALYRLPEGSSSNVRIFSVRHTPASLCSGLPASASALRLEGVIYCELTNNHQKSTKTLKTQQTTVRTLVYSTRAETRRQGVPWHRATQILRPL